MKHDKVSNEVLDYIAGEIDKTAFGNVTIELSENKKAIDVITTYRKRFNKEEVFPGTIPGLKEFKQG